MSSRFSISSFSLAFAAFIALPACSSATSPVAAASDAEVDSGALDAGPTIEGACTDLARARCLKLQTCSLQTLTTRDGDEGTCETREKAACSNGLSALGTGSTPASSELCVAAIGTATCAQFLGNVPIPACAAKVGSVPNGAGCGFNSQCASSFCAVAKGSACGTCTDLPKVGDSCVSTGCGPNLHCGKTSALCVAFASAGSACDEDDVCDFGLGCVAAKGATAGTCQPLVETEGGACDAKEQTTTTCDRTAGLWCPATGQCAKVSSFAAAGAPCGLVDATTFVSCNSGGCIVPTGGAGKGTCAPAAVEGAACDIAGNGSSCVAGTRCAVIGTATTGTCVSTSTCK